MVMVHEVVGQAADHHGSPDHLRCDVFYQGTLKWNQGVHNTMVYVTGNIPSGTYDNSHLANLSFGWVAVDWGTGHTYFDPKTGH
jgi:hypothetical protein